MDQKNGLKKCFMTELNEREVRTIKEQYWIGRNRW